MLALIANVLVSLFVVQSDSDLVDYVIARMNDADKNRLVAIHEFNSMASGKVQPKIDSPFEIKTTKNSLRYIWNSVQTKSQYLAIQKRKIQLLANYDNCLPDFVPNSAEVGQLARLRGGEKSDDSPIIKSTKTLLDGTIVATWRQSKASISQISSTSAEGDAAFAIQLCLKGCNCHFASKELLNADIWIKVVGYREIEGERILLLEKVDRSELVEKATKRRKFLAANPSPPTP
jgi:hypothetical protein